MSALLNCLNQFMGCLGRATKTLDFCQDNPGLELNDPKVKSRYGLTVQYVGIYSVTRILISKVDPALRTAVQCTKVHFDEILASEQKK